MSAPPAQDEFEAALERAERAELLLAAAASLNSTLELSGVLGCVLETARDLSGARYAALGVLGEDRRSLADFITVGLSSEERAAIGDPPHGHGVLGLLIERPEPLRLHDVSTHPRSYGFPAGHPPMGNFLGVPIVIRGEGWGILYLTDKAAAPDFTDADVDAIVTLAGWAAVAIDNARLYGAATERQRRLERSLRTAHTTMEITTAIGADTDLGRTLALIVKRARALVEADTVLVWLRTDGDLEMAAAAGASPIPVGHRVAVNASTIGDALNQNKLMRVSDVRELRISPSSVGLPDVTSALIVPLVHRGARLGVLVAMDRMGVTASFDDEDLDTLRAFVQSAAIAVATARNVEELQLERSLEAAEAERRRWARELHDETLQGLAALKLALGAALRSDGAQARPVLQDAMRQADEGIRGLRDIIADLRPAALDELGLEPALRALVDRVCARGQLDADLDLELGPTRLPPALETVAYRVVQEALTNIVKHARASTISVCTRSDGHFVHIVVLDDGQGMGVHPGQGFGLLGMRERAELAGGALNIHGRPSGGTSVELQLPLRD